MWETKDFVVPHFNYIEYLEKPVLAPLVTALGYALFGVSALTARLPSLLSGLAGIALAAFFVRRYLGSKAALYAAVILATSAGYFLMTRFAMIDMMLSLLLEAALVCLAIGHIDDDRRFTLGAYVCMGLAMLTKGLIGVVLPVLVMLVYLAVSRELRAVKKLRLFTGMAIVAAIFVPWGIAISIREPEFSYVFITLEHLSRYAAGGFGRTKPFWFYIPIFIAFSYPWTFFLPEACLRVRSEGDPKAKQALRFLLVWIATIVAFFSLSHSKLPYYLLPVAAPLAMLIGWHLSSGRASSKAVIAVCVSGAVALAGLDLYLIFWNKDPRGFVLTTLMRYMSLVLLTGGAASFYLIKQKKPHAVFWVLAGSVYAFLLSVCLAMLFLTPFLSTEHESKWLNRHLQPDDMVAVYASPDRFSDLPFHLKRRVVIVGSDLGTLSYEANDPEESHDLEDWHYDTQQFSRLFNTSERRIFCLLKKNKKEDIKQLKLDRYWVIKEGYGKTLICNRKVVDSRPS